MGAVGGKLKELGCAHWNCPNALADDSTGFTALPGGYRNGSNGYGFFSMLNFHSGWWTSTEYDLSTSWILNLNYDNGNADNYFLPKTFGFYVRCVMDSTTQINEINYQNKIKIYPNPVTNNLNIESQQKAVIEILNIQGQAILQKQIQQGNTDIDISGLAKGLYILRLYSNYKTEVTRFVKE